MESFCYRLPNYPHDLNAVHEAEKTLLDDQITAVDYIDALETVCRTDGWEIMDSAQRIAIVRATARPRGAIAIPSPPQS